MRAGLQDHQNRCFLFLQGPHGPFFARLGERLRLAGATVYRMGFNPGDQMFWHGPGFLPYHGAPEDLGGELDRVIKEHGVTDLVCYGSSRAIHQTALDLAEARGLTSHVFEEGYLRPYWVTYERNGANANSPVTHLTLDEMARGLEHGAPALTEAPDHWGDMRAHMFWGAAYHACLLVGAKAYPAFRPHRHPGVKGEFWLHFRRLIETPVRALRRRLATTRIKLGGFPFHLVLLQLAHDANFLDHGPFPDQATFLDTVFRGFSEGAPAHHHLVLKAHPLEDGREPLRPLIRRLTQEHGLEGRVHFVSGGKLAPLLDAARSALTVNSTAAEQALWRALPLKVFGEAIFNRPEFVSGQPLPDFFADPTPPKREAYLTYRAFLLATSQIPGGFYGFISRRKLLRQVPDLMLYPDSTYDRLLDTQDEAPRQHLFLVE
jgi:capsular polysaccharide export protein